jgi:hypothetical protein
VAMASQGRVGTTRPGVGARALAAGDVATDMIVSTTLRCTVRSSNTARLVGSETTSPHNTLRLSALVRFMFTQQACADVPLSPATRSAPGPPASIPFARQPPARSGMHTRRRY